MVRLWFYGLSIVVVAAVITGAWIAPATLWALVVLGPLVIIGLYDSLQRRHTVLRNFPLIGHGRYLFEVLRPEVHQYFIESNIDAFPIEREFREVVYQRSKGELETRPFGTQHDVYRVGYEWAPHSLHPVEPVGEAPRIQIGGPDCAHPYSASLLNISAMSYGALSKNAVLALIDGGEGGTGAAPLEFSNSLGMPARDGWMFVNNALIGTGLRQRVRVIATGKILTGFHMIRALALGADLCASARGMMLAMGCIQALRCNTNACPTGITTQRPALVSGLDVTDKATRVARYHTATLRGFLDFLGAMGLRHPGELGPQHIFRRARDLQVRSLGDSSAILEEGQLLSDGDTLPGWCDDWQSARADRW